MTATHIALEPSLVFYPFADRFVPRDTALTAGAVLPCSGVKVQKKPLGDSIVAVALWSLRETGAIRLEMFEKKRLLGKQRRLGVTRTGTAGDGFAASLLPAVSADGPDKNTVEDVVWRWMREDVGDPHGVVLSRVVEHLASAGYFSAMSGMASVKDQLRAGTGHQPDCARLEVLRPAFEALAGSWAAFTSSEAELHGQLLKEIGRGIGRRRERSDSDSDSGGGTSFD